MPKLLTHVLLVLGPATVAAPAPIPADSVRYWATHIKAGLNANESLLSKNWKPGAGHPARPQAAGQPAPIACWQRGRA